MEGTTLALNGFAHGSVYIYRVYLDSKRDYEMRFQLLDNLQEEGLPLYADTLANQEENPFSTSNIFLERILIDPVATEVNGGTPVVLAHGQYRSPIDDPKIMFETYNRIFSYDVVANKMTVIQEGIVDSIREMFLYGDTVFYSTNAGENGYMIHRISTDSTGFATMENPDARLYDIVTIYGDRLYYKDSSGLYSCALDFTDHKCHKEGAISSRVGIFCYGDYIYYTDHTKYYPTSEQYPLPGESLCRIPINGEGDEEILFEGACAGMACNGKLYYVSAENAVSSSMDVYDILYEYDVETGEAREIFNWQDESIFMSLVFPTEDYLLCNKTDNTTGETVLVCIDLETLEIKEIPS
ncbi:MAG: DUF5050 domain-containing protein [Clostridia bacterium]|nr:DUF5050 domain-containing protein [Clostridia bacterium]